jgi:hypothetical protein
VQYDFAGRLTSMSWLWNAMGYGGNTVSESRTYNTNGQLASIYWPSSSGVYQIQYNYSATQNNGQITQEVDNGSAITYQYDALKRLTSASGGGMGQKELMLLDKRLENAFGEKERAFGALTQHKKERGR